MRCAILDHIFFIEGRVMEPIALMDVLGCLESIKSGSMNIFQALEQICALSCINPMKLPYLKNKKSDFFLSFRDKKPIF